MHVEQEANRLLNQMSFAELCEYERRLTERIYELKLSDVQEYRKLIPTVSRMIHVHGHMNRLVEQVNEAVEGVKSGKDDLKCKTLLGFWQLPLHVAMGRCLVFGCEVPKFPSNKLKSPLEVTICLHSTKLRVDSFIELHRVRKLEEEFQCEQEVDLSYDGDTMDKVTIRKVKDFWERIDFTLDRKLLTDAEEHESYLKLKLPESIEIYVNNLVLDHVSDCLVRRLEINIIMLDFISNANDYVFPTIDVSKDALYYSQLPDSTLDKLQSLKAMGAEIEERRVLGELEECVDIYDVLVLLHTYAITKRNAVNVVDKWCGEKGWDVDSLVHSYTFGQAPHSGLPVKLPFTVPEEPINERFSF